MEPLISIIEDDQSVRAALQRILASHGFAAATFASAEEFLGSDRPFCAACLVVDVRMPGMSGLRLHQHLLAAGHRIPTILITGCPTAVDRDAALKAGVTSYLPKPFSEQALLDEIGLALGQGSRQGGSTEHDECAAAERKVRGAYV